MPRIVRFHHRGNRKLTVIATLPAFFCSYVQTNGFTGWACRCGGNKGVNFGAVTCGREATDSYSLFIRLWIKMELSRRQKGEKEMTWSPELEKRRGRLADVLEGHATQTRRRARWNHRTSMTLMVLSVLCSVTAAGLGFFTSQSSRLVGGIAILTPLIAYVAVNLKLEGKASWHHRKSNALRALSSRLRYELPEEPTAEEIAEVSKAYDTLNVTMQREWDATLSFNWRGLGRPETSVGGQTSGTAGAAAK